MKFFHSQNRRRRTTSASRREENRLGFKDLCCRLCPTRHMDLSRGTFFRERCYGEPRADVEPTAPAADHARVAPHPRSDLHRTRQKPDPGKRVLKPIIRISKADRFLILPGMCSRACFVRSLFVPSVREVLQKETDNQPCRPEQIRYHARVNQQQAGSHQDYAGRHRRAAKQPPP